MKFLYNISIYLYYLLVKIGSIFNQKAKFFVKGRVGLLTRIEREVEVNSNIIWVHCSSVGEFEQSRPIIEWYKREKPEYKILLTFFSPSGYENRKNYKLADWIYYLPIDTKKNASKFIEIVKPAKVIFIKYEFWYNYLKELKNREIDTYIVSAIFRDNQVFFKKQGSLFREMLTFFTKIFVQDEDSKKLLSTLGITDNVYVCGDTRFDRVSEVLNENRLFPQIEKFTKGQFTIIAGSTWAPDEKILYESLKAFPQVKLVIAPHEVADERIEQIINLFSDKRVVRYSKYDQELPDADVLIVDTIGMLSHIYKYGNVAYIGGGFGTGIHNILEAATYYIPVIFGPKYQKFKEARDLVKLKGAISVEDADVLGRVFEMYVTNSQALEKGGEICGEYVNKNLGATVKIVSLID